MKVSRYLKRQLSSTELALPPAADKRPSPVQQLQVLEGLPCVGWLPLQPPHPTKPTQAPPHSIGYDSEF